MFVLKNYFRRQVSLPLGSLARVLYRQPQECFFPCSFPTPCPFYRGGREGRGPCPGSTSGCISAPPRGLPTLLGETGAHMEGRAWATSWAGVPPGLSPPSGGHAPMPPPRCPQRPPEPGSGLAGSPTPGSLGPGARSPSLGLRSPGSPYRTVSSAPPPTYCLPPWGLSPGPSEPEGPRKRQAPGRRRYPARLSGPRRRRLHRPLASSAPAPAPPQPLARPRGQDITWQPHTSGAGLRAPPAPTAQARPLPVRERTLTSSALPRLPLPASRRERA